jgi:peptidyl-prolyl cis-trans isomerase C
MNRPCCTFGWLVPAIALAAGLAAAQQPAAERPTAARVNDQPVTLAEVEREFRQAYGERKLSEAERQTLAKAAREQVIDRRLVLSYLTSTGQAASAADIDFAQEQFQKDLKSQGITLESHLKEVGLTRDEFRQTLAWKLSWQRYVQRHLTDENLQKYFMRHRREFDGSELRVAQILFTLAPGADDAAVAAAKDKAMKLRAEIAAEKLTFAEAARRHSQAPSAAAGGDIGWIERRRPMPEDFSQTAYALQPGEISQPLVSPFGVHLITVLEAKPGQRTWQDAAGELRPAVTLYLFRWIADQERAKAKIEYVDGAK